MRKLLDKKLLCKQSGECYTQEIEASCKEEDKRKLKQEEEEIMKNVLSILKNYFFKLSFLREITFFSENAKEKVLWIFSTARWYCKKKTIFKGWYT